MKQAKDINIWSILKALCIAICTILLLSACGDDENAKMSNGASEDQMAVAQRFECATTGKVVHPEVDGTCPAGTYPRCIQGSLVRVFYFGLGKMATDVYKNLTTEDLLSLMTLAFAIWLAFQVLRHVSSPSPESMGEFWTKALRQGTMCFACGYLASSTDNIMYVINTFVFPIYVTFLELTSSFLTILEPVARSSPPMTINGKVDTIPWDLVCSVPSDLSIKMTASEFPEEPLEMLSCMACGVSGRLNSGYTLALRGLFGNGLFPFIVGVFLMAAFLIAKWGFVFYLIDSLFRLVMMIIIMPFLILFYAFKQTRKWTISGFKIILSSSAVLLCLAVLIAMVIFAMSDILTNGEAYGDYKTYENFGTIPLTLVLLGFVVIKATNLAVSISNNMVGGGGSTRFQEKAAALIGTVAQGAFEVLTWGGGKAATFLSKHSARYRAIAQQGQKLRDAAGKIGTGMNRIAGRTRPDNNNGTGGEQ